jgi:uncharacterized membrane protein YvbJ
MSEVDKGGQIQTAITGIRQRMADADRRRKINLVKNEIQDLQSKEAQSINSLSAQVLALYEAGSLTQPELVSLCKGVDEIQSKIKDKEAELALIDPPPEPAAPEAPATEAVPAAAPAAAPAPDAEALCPSCGVAVVQGATFCQTCGGRLKEEKPPAPVLFCVHCGAQLREGARFCPKCGQTLPEA